jgi:hypothetical protein
MHPEIGIFDSYSRPNVSDEFVVTNQLACTLNEYNQYLDGPATKTHRFTIFQKLMPLRRELEWPKFDRPNYHCCIREIFVEETCAATVIIPLRRRPM